MSYDLQELKGYIGRTGNRITACDPVEKGAVRRFAQAIMDEDAKYGAEGIDEGGRSLAPPLFPPFAFRRALGTPDPLTARAKDDYFDGLSLTVNTGLPDLPLPDMGLLNGGAEIEFFDYARHGDRITQVSRYSDIWDKQSSKGPMIFVVTETDYLDQNDKLLLRVRQVNIRR